ncbi:MAG: cellulase [Moraxellaceae bacterium]|nr:MAG: cellulase [Moraxellaceae bacterium]
MNPCRRLAIFLMFTWVSGLSISAPCTDTLEWQDWQQFKQNFITSEGRVVDPSSEAMVTTSEGQSYGLFFALVDNDPNTFQRLLNWTHTHLARGDLSRHLPAWKWGKDAQGQWRVLDRNSASDSDLWIAYNLLEAGRLWGIKQYTVEGVLLAQRILREETVFADQLGRVLLPASRGFEVGIEEWRLNPSYLPIQLIRRLAEIEIAPGWQAMIAPAVEIVLAASPNGYSADWVNYSASKGFYFDADAVGSYGAIRVYLWAGMLDQEDPYRQRLLDTLRPMAKSIRRLGYPPEKINVRSLLQKGEGSSGFSAALLPFLDALELKALLAQQRDRINRNSPFEHADNYYEQVLSLFGVGWMEGRFRFGPAGFLSPQWDDVCHDVN